MLQSCKFIIGCLIYREWVKKKSSKIDMTTNDAKAMVLSEDKMPWQDEFQQQHPRMWKWISVNF